ncbi:ABC transporter ATP-binding protein (plasmid) [Cytobacillus firmus]|uniref:ABC transporter ATP-binding protein n=1 Tax=Cytobacillus firmus TaxID=1399 RepID=UPI00207A96EF|nr:ABC transporter ATP-binding protein [Cytobacillus firmus]USK41686.1 ABC transporter ATP-binding protein [Cytobacillus firmus]
MILSVEGLHKTYGKDKVLKGISFHINEPKIVALVGPNGAGKSTLLNILTNLQQADQGDVSILNKDNKNPEIFKEISFMQDNSVLYDYLTGYDHLQFIGDMQGIESKKLMLTAKRVGMDAYLKKKVGKYSLGMKQHLLLTMALVNDPKLLILDEPLNGLDPTSAIRVRDLLLEEHKKGTCILLSSHNLAEIDRLTPHILFIKSGVLIEENIAAYEKIFYHVLVDDQERAAAILKDNQVRVSYKDGKFIFSSEDCSLQTFILMMGEHCIGTLDVEKKVYGSEDRYQMIYMENGPEL